MLALSLCVCVGQLLWKLSADKGIWIMLLDFCFYGIGALIMLIAYRYGKLSVLLLSLNYVLSIILGILVLQESVTLLKCISVLVLVAGMVLIAGGDEV